MEDIIRKEGKTMVDKNIRRSFIKGFKWYKDHQGYELTNREIAELFPNVDTQAFAQGMIDAKYNDTWRLSHK